MANFTEIGINFSVFSSANFPDIGNFTNVTKQEFINNIPAQANTVTDGYYGIVVMVVMVIFLTQLLSDITQFGLFRYSTIRALAIGLGIASTFGIVMLSIGYMTNFIHLSIVITLYLFLLVYIIISNPS